MAESDISKKTTSKNNHDKHEDPNRHDHNHDGIGEPSTPRHEDHQIDHRHESKERKSMRRNIIPNVAAVLALIIFLGFPASSEAIILTAQKNVAEPTIPNNIRIAERQVISKILVNCQRELPVYDKYFNAAVSSKLAVVSTILKPSVSAITTQIGSLSTQPQAVEIENRAILSSTMDGVPMGVNVILGDTAIVRIDSALDDVVPNQVIENQEIRNVDIVVNPVYQRLSMGGINLG